MTGNLTCLFVALQAAPGFIRRICAIHLTGIALLTTLGSGGIVRAQEPATAPEHLPEQTQRSVAGSGTCLEPPPLIRWQDYRGPLQKTVGTIARRLERKTVHDPHYKQGVVLCSLELKDKFLLFVQDSTDPFAFLETGFNATLDQAQDLDPGFGQGAAGYGKRFGANFADQASFRFFSNFAYPAIFSEDPRYYRLGQGTGRQRFRHAVGHTFIAHRDNGEPMVNFSEWLGAASAVALSNLYHPGNRRGFSAAAAGVGYAVAADMGFDLLREFWPEVARKLRVPFRDRQTP